MHCASLNLELEKLKGVSQPDKEKKKDQAFVSRMIKTLDKLEKFSSIYENLAKVESEVKVIEFKLPQVENL